jgi:Xaa-Pro aminopeptidase
VSEALVMFDSGARSMDLFHAIPSPVYDPYLYAEIGGRRIAVLPHFDHENVRAVAPDVELRNPFELGLPDLLRRGVDRTTATLDVAVRALQEEGVTAAVVSWEFPAGLVDRLRAAGIDVLVDHRAFETRRRSKTPAQVAGVRRAAGAAAAAMGVAAQMVRSAPEGLTAERVRRAMQEACAAHDCDLEDQVIVAVNGQAANGHDVGSGPIAPGDLVLVDIWPCDRASRCWADMTRTFIAGGAAPDEEIRTYWTLAREALRRVTQAVGPGVDGRELYALAAEVFEDEGLPTLRTKGDGPMPEAGFLHSLGHGVGLAVHEAPALGLSGDPLVEGDVIAVEPGCYRQGVGGVRLEDLLLVTAGGCEVLTRFPYEL